uniref:Ty3/gypsy retrotransposon protein n=1 Tax=Tanacetum cinerariifolium TaxID=118510 RepID=A0A699GSN4_TANCI|nr:Ty3/gypsy retrotransposon protein [Tanacetum cinerariifolium]
MEIKANRHHREVEFNPGDKVLFKLQLYRHLNLAKRLSNKLSKRYYGPYEMLERVRKVAYRLALLKTSKIHMVFHVLILKDFLGNGIEEVSNLPEEFYEGHPVEQPLLVCDARTILRNGIPTQQISMQWVEATWDWEWLSEFQAAHLTYNLEDKVNSKERGNVTLACHGLGHGKRVKTAPGWHNEYVMG